MSRAIVPPRSCRSRRFPVTVWLREPHEFDYIVEPDVFHDFFGHVPLLFNPIVADYLQQYGQGGLKALKLGGLMAPQVEAGSGLLLKKLAHCDSASWRCCARNCSAWF